MAARGDDVGSGRRRGGVVEEDSSLTRQETWEEATCGRACTGRAVQQAGEARCGDRGRDDGGYKGKETALASLGLEESSALALLGQQGFITRTPSPFSFVSWFRFGLDALAAPD